MASLRQGSGGPSGMNDGNYSTGLWDTSQPSGWVMIFWVASIAFLVFLYFAL